ncbi:unnamed protein product, partial [Rotaria magnacalcarata]
MDRSSSSKKISQINTKSNHKNEIIFIFTMEHYESSLDKLDQLMQRYRRQDILRNQHYEDLSQRYYPFIKAFQLPLNHHCIYIHRLTSTEMLNNLINLASEIDYFTIDTQHHIEVY